MVLYQGTKLSVGMLSPYIIIAPRDIENTILTEQKAIEAANVFLTSD